MNDTQNTSQTREALLKLFTKDSVPEAETEAFLEEVGATIVESAVVRFVGAAEKEEIAAFETIIGSEPDPHAALPKLIENVPRFADILTEEVAAFQDQADTTL